MSFHIDGQEVDSRREALRPAPSDIRIEESVIEPLRVIAAAPEFLKQQQAGFQAPQSPTDHAPIYFEHSRGGLPIIPAVGVDAEASRNSRRVYVAANGGAQLHNSPLFYDSNPGSRALVHGNEYSTAGSMLAYTGPDDVFVHQSRRPELERDLFNAIVDSYESVGIHLTRNFHGVHSVSDWIDRNLGSVPILPNLLSFPMLCAMRENYNSVPMQRAAVANLAAYTKHGAQEIWAENNLPTPVSYYAVVGAGHNERVLSEIRDRFNQFDAVVVNRIDGSGGFGIRKVALNQLCASDLDFGPGEVLIQVQGFVQVKSSPCLIANIHSGTLGICGISEQRFSEFGVHMGNSWSQRAEERLLLDQDFYSLAIDALDSLRRAGVIGQVNVDFLCLDPEVRARYGLSSANLLREANVRPAGSSILLRLRQAILDGQAVESINTVSRALSGLEAFDELKDRLAAAAVPGVRRAVLCNAVVQDNNSMRVTLACLGSSACSSSELEEMERQVIG